MSTDQAFKRIDGLSWYPFVGRDYQRLKDSNKVLLVGESHYHYNSEGNATALTSNPNFTRRVIEEQVFERVGSKSNFFPNAERALLGRADIGGRVFWDKICFYNFIQRSMNSVNERPLKEDFEAGWPIYAKVQNILSPNLVIFLGVSAWFTLGIYGHIQGFEVLSKETEGKVGNTYLKTARIKTDSGKLVDLIFIKHPSSYFSWRTWHEALKAYLNSIDQTFCQSILQQETKNLFQP